MRGSEVFVVCKVKSCVDLKYSESVKRRSCVDLKSAESVKCKS